MDCRIATSESVRGVTYGVELVAQVNRVDVVAFEVGEHDDLRYKGHHAASAFVLKNGMIR
jgi:hypothetical protein